MKNNLTDYIWENIKEGEISKYDYDEMISKYNIKPKPIDIVTAMYIVSLVVFSILMYTLI